VIYVGTLAKVMFPTLRLGFAVIPEDLVGSFLDIRSAIDTAGTSMLYQMAMTDFIREGHLSRHIKRMRAAYMEKHKALVEALLAEADGILEVVGDSAGLYVLARLPPGIDDAELTDSARQMGLPVSSLSRCFASAPDRGGLMLGYSDVDIGEISAYVRSLMALIRCRTGKPRHDERRSPAASLRAHMRLAGGVTGVSP
jgi:GntR family transcriptional regulator / MocR family aminotransferase